MGRLRALIREALDEVAPPGDPRQYLRKSDVYGNIEYDPPKRRFTDRWGNSLEGPERMEPEMIRQWLDQHRVETISVRGHKMSPKVFLGRLAPSLQKGKIVPIVKGTPETPPPGVPTRQKHDRLRGFDTQLSKTHIRPGV